MLFLEACTTVRLPLGEMGYVERWVLMYRKLGGEIKQAPVARRIETCWYLEWVLSVHIAIYWIFVAGIEVLDIVVGICCYWSVRGCSSILVVCDSRLLHHSSPWVIEWPCSGGEATCWCRFEMSRRIRKCDRKNQATERRSVGLQLCQ